MLLYKKMIFWEVTEQYLPTSLIYQTYYFHGHLTVVSKWIGNEGLYNIQILDIKRMQQWTHRLIYIYIYKHWVYCFAVVISTTKYDISCIVKMSLDIAIEYIFAISHTPSQKHTISRYVNFKN